MPKFKNSNATFWVIFKQCDHLTFLISESIVVLDLLWIFAPKLFRLFLSSQRKNSNFFSSFNFWTKFLQYCWFNLRIQFWRKNSKYFQWLIRNWRNDSLALEFSPEKNSEGYHQFFPLKTDIFVLTFLTLQKTESFQTKMTAHSRLKNHLKSLIWQRGVLEFPISGQRSVRSKKACAHKSVRS